LHSAVRFISVERFASHIEVAEPHPEPKEVKRPEKGRRVQQSDRKSVLPSGVMAAELGNPPTGMADPALLVDTRIGVTVLSLAFTV
jgi:hypothetical protein